MDDEPKPIVRRLTDLFSAEYLEQQARIAREMAPFFFDTNAVPLPDALARNPNVEFERTLHVRECMGQSGLKLKPWDGKSSSHWSLPLIVVAQFENPQAAADLLARGAQVDGRDRYGNRALLVALHNGHVETTRLLLNHGASPHHEKGDGMPPLFWAIRHYQDRVDGRGLSPKETSAMALVGALLEAGADPNASGGTGYSTALVEARDHPELVSLLLRHRADPDHTFPVGTDEQGQVYGGDTLLHILAEGQSRRPRERRITDTDFEVARILAMAEAALELRDARGQTPAERALANPWVEEDGERFAAWLETLKLAHALDRELPLPPVSVPPSGRTRL